MAEKKFIEEGKKLQKSREEKEFTIRQLADHTGISWQKLTYCEKGASALTKMEANKIARVLGITTEGLPILAPKKAKPKKAKGKKVKGKKVKGKAKGKTKGKVTKKTGKSKTASKGKAKTSSKSSGTTKVFKGASTVTGVKIIDEKNIILLSGKKEYHFQFNSNIKKILSKVFEG